ncbi:type II toxin-antitoxin system RelE/ParE family toxin [Pseudorhodoferax sp. Leaf267]|uniref:type II toxin-antitoxin system RelE/ParE family toxin n=1 Tax=Pseudorhodoferax sp. Leaf267 TaxID=1736316 RepID=UPI0006F256D4|nr:type II toxin-antitoxin system RelE/ParE family toxin [Pseudorhodoferax sp. Leaf267]KQP23089.1 plasmid stabilization protein [Pseudorhodoferax sp. Leaf267]
MTWELRWTSKALGDLVRLHEFLAPVNPAAAAKAVQALTRAPERLLEHPRIGEPLQDFAPREVRRLLVAQYEIRYELVDRKIYLLRIWHTREHR